MLPLPCMLVCIFVCANRTRDRGCSKHPVFPAPSISKRANEIANLGLHAPRECETVSTVIASEAKQSMSRHKERMDCFAALAMTVSKDIAMPQQKRRTFRPAAHAHVIAVRLR